MLVAVEACGVCSWEQRVFRGAKPQYPFAGGHEVGGSVMEAPNGELPVGARVAVSRLPRCGLCDACRAGKDNLCAYGTGATADPDGPGGLTEYLLASPQDVVTVRASAPETALAEPLACVLNSLDIAGVGRASAVVIVGNGFMGVLHARAAAAVGAYVTVVATSPVPAGLEGAWAGATIGFAEAVGQLDRCAFDAVILIRDVTSSLGLAGELVRPGGTVSVFASVPSGTAIGLPARLLRIKELRLTAAASHRDRDFQAAARMISDGVVRVDDLVHRVFPLRRVRDALEYATAFDTGRIIVTTDFGER